MGIVNVLFGRPLASSEDEGQRISPTQGIPTFGLDALSSAAYGPEAALTILLPLALVGVRYIVRLIPWAVDRTPSPRKTWGTARACWQARL
jgi:hypothetical protein